MRSTNVVAQSIGPADWTSPASSLPVWLPARGSASPSCIARTAIVKISATESNGSATGPLALSDA